MLIAAAGDAPAVLEGLRAAGEEAFVCGELAAA
jgi:hypothetical protein